MGNESSQPTGPDLSQGVPLAGLADGAMVAGYVGDQAILLARRGSEYFAVDAHCTHYHGPLAEGLMVGDTVRCPWHHACFSLRTGEALHAPAFTALSCWKVEQRSGKLFVNEKLSSEAKSAKRAAASGGPRQIVIVGGGAAGFAAAEMLRREGYAGGITMLSADDAPPCDRPNLSKDYLAGSAPEDWIPLQPPEFYQQQAIDLHLGADVIEIASRDRRVSLRDGRTFAYDKLLLATGAEPVRLPIPGADQPHVHVLRTLADSRAIVADAQTAHRAVVIGASFIGLEAAASLRARNIEVHVVAPETRLMERILGAEMGDFVRALHEEHGVIFHLGDTASAIEGKSVKLKGGAALDADLVVVGVGVRPRIALAEQAGLKIDRGVVVDEYLQTSDPDIFAAGDIARWPDRHTGENLRIEHWVVAERQGQTAARNMLGLREPYVSVPFFWSQHYDVPINYVGHAQTWDRIDIDGDIKSRDCLLRYRRNGKVLAVASIYRDVASLEAEVAMEA